MIFSEEKNPLQILTKSNSDNTFEKPNISNSDFDLKKQISYKSADQNNYNNKNHNNNNKNLGFSQVFRKDKDIEENNEIYLNKRKYNSKFIKIIFLFNPLIRATIKIIFVFFNFRKQIYFLIFPFFICATYNFIYVTLRHFIIFDQFTVKAFRVIPKNESSAILQFMNDLACIIPILSNYISFYFVIRDSYKKEKKKSDNVIVNNDIVRFSDVHGVNKDIEEYLN